MKIGTFMPDFHSNAGVRYPRVCGLDPSQRRGDREEIERRGERRGEETYEKRARRREGEGERKMRRRRELTWCPVLAVKIAMAPGVDSLNVHVSAAVALHALFSRRGV